MSGPYTFHSVYIVLQRFITYTCEIRIGVFMRFVLATLLLLLLSCRGQWVTMNEYTSYTENREVGCFTLGFCWRCEWVGMHYFCGNTPYDRCPGNKWVMVEVIPESGYYVNYPDKILTIRRERYIKDISECMVEHRFRLKEGQYKVRNPEE